MAAHLNPSPFPRTEPRHEGKLRQLREAQVHCGGRAFSQPLGGIVSVAKVSVAGSGTQDRRVSLGQLVGVGYGEAPAPASPDGNPAGPLCPHPVSGVWVLGRSAFMSVTKIWLPSGRHVVRATFLEGSCQLPPCFLCRQIYGTRGFNGRCGSSIPPLSVL